MDARVDVDRVLSCAVCGCCVPPPYALVLPLKVAVTHPFSFPGLSEPVHGGRAGSWIGLVLRTLPIFFSWPESV